MSTERFNHAGVIVSDIENIILVFWKLHSKSTWLKNLRGHDASAASVANLGILSPNLATFSLLLQLLLIFFLQGAILAIFK